MTTALCSPATSEPAIAFVSGFSTFLSCAFRNDPFFYEVPAGGGLPTVFRLDQHTGFAPTGGGEFYSGSVARTLWGIWKNAAVFNGSPNGLQTMWNATLASQPSEYGNTPLACYPTYLTGLKRLAGASASIPIGNELNLENVGNGVDPTSSIYLNGTTLWATGAIPLSATGSLQTYVSTANRYYDRNQSQAYRFTHNGTGPRTITMTPTGGQDFYLELIGPGGWVAGSFSTPGSTRTLTFTNLPAGTYAARVRAGATTATGSYGYTISVS